MIYIDDNIENGISTENRNRFNVYLKYFSAGKFEKCETEIKYNIPSGTTEQAYATTVATALKDNAKVVDNSYIFVTIDIKILTLMKELNTTLFPTKPDIKVVILDLTQLNIDTSKNKEYFYGHYIVGAYFRDLEVGTNQKYVDLYESHYWNFQYIDEYFFYAITTMNILSEIYNNLGSLSASNLNFFLQTYSYHSFIGSMSFGVSQYLSAYAYVAQIGEDKYTFVSKYTSPIVQQVFVQTLADDASSRQVCVTVNTPPEKEEHTFFEAYILDYKDQFAHSLFSAVLVSNMIESHSDKAIVNNKVQVSYYYYYY